jgi:broad specificity phosphatase PhoE
MRKLIFIRHSAVQIDPALPAREWRLSADGRLLAQQLAPQIASHNPTRIITSVENKAIATGQIIAETLDIPWQTAPNLHEHERRSTPYFASKADFETAVARFFAQPDQLVFGDETANQAFERFDTAVRQLIAQHPTDILAIVAHGTVLTLFLAHYNQFAPFPFWQKIKLPDYFVVAWPDFTFHDSRFAL